MSVKHVVLRSTSGGGLEGMPTAGPATLAPKLSVDVQLETLQRGEAAELERQKGVIGVAPVIPMRLIAPIDVAAVAAPAAGTTWGVQAVKADTSPFDGDGIIPAVLDTGIDPNHPALAGVNLIRKNFTNASDDDEHGHGTHCAGTIFGRDVSGTRIGVARGVKQAVIGKVLGGNGGGSDTIMQAIQWAVQNGANVISMSLGIDFPGFVKELEGQGLPTELATSIALEGYRTNVLLFERLASLVQAGGAFMQATVLVAAAGNESQRDVNPD